jgi:cytoskeletal protein CcmA (bactofilin family)
MFKKQKNQQKTIETLIGAGTRIEGNITFKGGMRIDGEVLGNVKEEAGQDSRLVIGENARIRGSVTCAHLIVNGQIDGPVTSTAQLELQARAKVLGDVDYLQIEMQPGAIVQGHLDHQASVKAVELKLAVG